MNRISRVILLFFFALTASQNVAFGDDHWVTRVLDGDTIVLDNGERVRLIGVDTTEKSHPLKPLQYFSEEATEFTKHMVEGSAVRLEYDSQRRDKYDRLLAYVFLLNGTFVNAEIIKRGYGFAYTKYPFRYADKFLALEKEAKREKLGYWKSGGTGELRWIKQNGGSPFLLYQMSQGLWGIEYGSFLKTRLRDSDLTQTLNDLRIWICEFHEDDLAKHLLDSGWERMSTP